MNDSASTLRAFIAIDLDDKLRGKIDSVQRRLNSRIARGLRFIPPAQVHLTLRFLGEIPETQIALIKTGLDRACTGTAPLKLSLENIGCFPNISRPSVVWVGVTGEISALSTLQARIEQEVGTLTEHREDRDFKAHLTIGRVKSHLSKERREIGSAVQSLKIGQLGEWTVSQVVLYKSELGSRGPSYTRLHSAKL